MPQASCGGCPVGGIPLLAFRILVPLALAAALAVPASATHCPSGDAHPWLVVEAPATPAGQYYVLYDHGCDPECHSPWLGLYEESNGIPGLQAEPVWHDYACGYGTYDTVIF